jgi:hypothetical protein
MSTDKVIINGERFIISDKHILIGKNDIEYKGIIDYDGYLVGYLKKEVLNNLLKKEALNYNSKNS